MARHLLPLCGLALASGQLAGTLSQEGAPSVKLRECTKARGCRPRRATVTLDANWRWLHAAEGYKSCFTNETGWDAELCPDPQSCASNCALEGVTSTEYDGLYGITLSRGWLELKFARESEHGDNYGSRVFLLDGQQYVQFRLLNREFSFDVDVSRLPCGLNGALYFVEMDKSGGMGGGNQAGARYGTGYCDSHCPRDVKYLAGEMNLVGWGDLEGVQVGQYGSCCAEMSVWEANSMATAFTAHPCAVEGPTRCQGADCGEGESRYDGLCDQDGCDFNPYRMGQASFYGAGAYSAIDTSRPFTVVTQFLTDDGTDTGNLTEIRRFYVQGGVAVPNPNATVLSDDAVNSITDGYCRAQKDLFADVDDTADKGGLARLGRALGRGVVLAISLRDDPESGTLWLDSTYPEDGDSQVPGIGRGPCPGGESSKPEYLRANYPDAAVRFANLAIGEIGTTVRQGRSLRGGDDDAEQLV